jgi:heme-degrading monooxygenase HmoA
VADRTVLRLYVFAPNGITRVVDTRLRDELAPDLAAMDGLVASYLGRRGSETQAERIIVTVWESPAAHDTAAAGALGSLEAEVGPGRAEVLPLAIDLDDPRPEAPAVLRVFRGTVHEGLLEAYVDRARKGTLADIAANVGPLDLFLAELPPDQFVTVSVWADWQRIMAATGGNLGRPIATQHREHLLAGTAAHYEVIPTSVSGRLRRATAVD